jgi:hypothetical protein
VTERAPDPFRPGDVPEGRPYAKVGRPGFAVAVALVVVAAAVALVLFAVLR